MLKTFIASIRSDKAVKELDKIGIKVKEVGEDGVERFRDVQQVILDIAIKTKYAEQDIQKTLLAISGGKFQWAKVAAMLSDYKEIIKNWDSAITSQGFTDKQVEAQLDTVARKFQVLKDQITNIMVGGNNDHISNLLKGWLDCINGILKTINSIPPSMQGITIILSEIVLAHIAIKRLGNPFTAISKGYESIKTQAIATSASIRALGGSFIGMRVMAITSINTIKAAMSRFLPTLILVGVGEAIGWVAEKLHIFGDAMEDVETKQMQEYDKQTRLISIYEQRKGLVSALTSSYALLLQQQKDTSLSAEKKAQVDKDVAETEKRLTKYILDDGVSRIKNSEDVAMAAEQERVAYAEKTDKSIEACEKERKVVLGYAQAKVDSATELISSYERDKEAYIKGAKEKMHACGALAKLEIAYYKLRQNFSNWRLSGLEKDLERYQGLKKELSEKAKTGQLNALDSDDYIVYADKVDALKKEIEETKGAIEYFDIAQFETSWEDTLKEANKDLQEGLNIKGHANQNPPSGGTETDPTTEKGNSSKGDRGSHYRPSKEHDPVVTAINNAVKLIEKKFDKQIKSIEQDLKDKGASKTLTEQNWHFHEEKINSLKEQLEKAKTHLKEQDAAIFDNEVTLDSSKEIREGIISEAKSYLGTPYEYGGEDREGIDCSAFVQNVFREKGIQISRTVDAQAEDYARSGAFKDSLDGAQIGDLVFFGDNEHIGILTGKDKDGNWEMINSASHSGVSYATIAPGNYWGNWLTGVGRTSEYANMEVPFTQKLSEVLKMTKDEWVKAGIDGQQALLDNAMNSEEYKDDENTLKFLNAVKTKIIESAKAVNDLQDKIRESGISQRDAWFSNIQAEINAAKTKSDRQVDRYSRSLGLGATDADKAVFEMMKFSNELAATNEVLHREQSLSMKDTEKYLELQDKLEALIQSVQETKIKYIQAQYTENIRQMEHNSKMRWYGKDNENDLLGRQRATDTARDEMYKLRQLVARYRAIEKETPENQKALDETLELIKESAVKVQEAMTKYSKAMRDGFYKISEEFLFEAKSFKDIITGLWQDLGKDSLKVLFRQDISNPSFLGQWLGIGMPKKENLTEDAFYQFSKESALDSIDKISAALGGTGSPLLAKLKDTNFALEKSMDLSKILETDHMLALKLNTLAIQNLTTAMGMSAASNATGGLLGAVTGGGWFGSLGSAIGTFYAPGGGAASPVGAVTKMLRGTATGGRLGVDGKPMLSKFADGGAMASGKIQGAGTGRSDSILAYLANKDKFVWLSNGEYVINEKSAKALGYDTLDSLNKYADGGALQTSVTNPTPYIPTINPQVAQKATTIHGSNKITEALLREQNKHMMEQNEMLRNMGNNSEGNSKMVVLNTQASSADVLRALQENPRALQAILGRQKSMGFR